MKHNTQPTGRWLLLFLAGFGGLMLFFGSAAVAGAARGLALCGSTVIPSLFPFFVLSGTLIGMGAGDALAQKLAKPLRRWFGIAPQGGMALVMGLLGGYPLGARAVCNLYEEKRITQTDAQRLLCFANNTGPSFFVGAVGLGVFGSVKIGLLLYLIHALSALLVGRFFAVLRSQPRSPYSVQPFKASRQRFAAAFSQAVVSSCSSMLAISGFVVFFSALLSVGKQLLPALDVPVLSGFLEMTSGVMALRDLAPLTAFCLASCIISWGGLCVHCQTLSIAYAAGLEPRGYLTGKLLHALTATVLCLPVAAILFGHPAERWLFWLIPAVFLLLMLFFAKFAKKRTSISCQNCV